MSLGVACFNKPGQQVGVVGEHLHPGAPPDQRFQQVEILPEVAFAHEPAKLGVPRLRSRQQSRPSRPALPATPITRITTPCSDFPHSLDEPPP